MRNTGDEIAETSRRRGSLLARSLVSRDQHGRWLVIANDVALLDAIDRDAVDSLTWLTTDYRTARLIACDNGDVVNGVDTVSHGANVVVIDNVPDRGLMRRWIAQAASTLGNGGTLIIGGANDEGVRTAIRDASEVFGPPADESYGARQRVARYVRGGTPQPPAWLAEPGIAPGTWARRNVVIDRVVHDLATLPGVFASGALDAGTAMLLDHLDIPPGGRILDVGCGAGIIALAAALRGAGEVHAVDVNMLAVAATARNLAAVDVPTRAFTSDVFSDVGAARYDLIVANPPFHRGKVVDLTVADRLIQDASNHLDPGGRLVIVANAFLAYGRRMEAHFRTVRTVAADRRYHVLEART